MPVPTAPKMRSGPCKPAGKEPRAAGLGYLGSGAAFLAVAWLGHQPAFTGVGFAFIGLGVAWLLHGRGRR